MLNDLRLACKRLRRAPGFALIAASVLALAVGANTAIFTVADAVLFRPLPYADPDRLFVVRSVDKHGVRSSFVPYEYVAALQLSHSDVAAVGLRSTTMFMDHAGPEGGESVETFRAAPDYFHVLGVVPHRGRLFDATDAADGHRRVILTYESWRARYAGDESIIGREVKLGSTNRTVVGVLPPAFIFPSASLFKREVPTGRAEFAMVAAPPTPAEPLKRSNITLGGYASDAVIRLRSGVTRDQAQARLDVLVQQVRASRPQDAGTQIVLEDVRSVLFPSGRQILWLLLIAAGLVLLLGCANLANLLAARVHRRQRDIAIQSSLGAGPAAVIRQVFFEALMIGMAAAVLAVAAAAALSDAFMREVPPVAYGRAQVGVDLRVAAFAGLLGVAAGLLFAVWPAWQASRMDVQALMRHSALRMRQARRGRSLIVVQVALAIVLAAAAAAAALQFREVARQPLGFNPDNLATITVGAPNLSGDALKDFYRRVTAAVEQQEDVIRVGVGSSRPFDRGSSADALENLDQNVWITHIVPGYLEALGVQLREGNLPQSDTTVSGLEPAVLTRSAARRLFPDRPAVGDLIRLEGRNAEVVAVIDDVVTDFAERPSWIYVVPRESNQLSTLIVRTRSESGMATTGLRRRVASVASPTAPITVRWLSESIGAHPAYRGPRFQTVVLGGFSTLAMGLAFLGVLAIVGASVALRTREMGLRLAIGAPRSALIRLIVSEALVSVGAGIVVVVLVAEGFGRVASALVAGVHSAGAGVLILCAAVVLLAGVIAAYLPARHASRVDPLVVLRTE